jgi:hypothetical protein
MRFPTRQAMALPARTLASIYRPRYVVLNIAAFVVYYYAYFELIAYQNLGVFLSDVSEDLLYLLVLTSSMLLTVAVYSVRNTRNNSARVSATTLGTVTTLFGGVIGGCGCSVPVISSLAVVGLSASEVVSLNNFLADYQNEIFGLMVLGNLAVIVYYLFRLSSASCVVTKVAAPG